MTANLSSLTLELFIVLALWELAWKGVALWIAARNNAKVWFIAILVINSAGLLPIAYLLFSRRVPPTMRE